MPRPVRRSACFVCIAIVLTFMAPAQAQKSDSVPSPPAETNLNQPLPPAREPMSEDDISNRRAFREERQNIRAEHDELENERDQLHMQCMNAKGQDRSICHDRFEALHHKMDDLHERLKALHEHIRADRRNGMPENKNRPDEGEAPRQPPPPDAP